ncbi:MAG: hypothetical protein R3E09_06625 [Novosphingobium sp.]|nr:hypothetical protein [Novosphingobium sp.]
MRWTIAAACLAVSSAASAQEETPAPEPQNVLVEIYRIAPGKHREFLEAIASYDEANRLAGLPPRQLYVHQDGAGWDFMLIQPAHTPDDKREALNAAWDRLGLPSGPDFFFTFRSMIAEHSDTFASGPTSAAAYLARAKDD